MPEKKPKPEATVVYDVTFTPRLATKAFEIMSRMDLGITGGEIPVCYRYTWTTTSKVDSAYLRKMRKAIRKGLKELEITQIHSIKRVKI